MKKVLIVLSLILLSLNLKALPNRNLFKLSHGLTFLFETKGTAIFTRPVKANIKYFNDQGSWILLELTGQGELFLKETSMGLKKSEIKTLLENVYKETEEGLTDFDRNGAILQQFYRNLLGLTEIDFYYMKIRELILQF